MTDIQCIHAVAKCEDCGWEESDYLKNVTELARNHAKEKRHIVNLEKGYMVDGTIPSRKLKSFGILEEGYDNS